MRFVQLTPDLSEVWDKLVHCSDDAWLYHRYDWLQFTEKVWDLESRSFLVEHDREIVGIMPLQMHKKSRVLRSIFMGTGGAATSNELHPTFRARVLRAMYEHVEEIARRIKAPHIEIYIPPLAGSCMENRWGVNPLINYSYVDTSTHTWVVDLAADRQGIFARMSKDARRSVSKATEAGYKVREIESIDEIEEYYKVHCETYRRTGVSPHPKAYFQGIYKHVCKNGHATIWKALAPNGLPIAFEIIGLFKSGAIYWAGCCRSEHLHSGVNYFLQYSSMIWAKTQGAKWFENGEAFPNTSDKKLMGLTTFKGKFGGELHRFYKGTLTLTSQSKRTNIFRDRLRRFARCFM